MPSREKILSTVFPGGLWEHRQCRERSSPCLVRACDDLRSRNPERIFLPSDGPHDCLFVCLFHLDRGRVGRGFVGRKSITDVSDDSVTRQLAFLLVPLA